MACNTEHYTYLCLLLGPTRPLQNPPWQLPETHASDNCTGIPGNSPTQCSFRKIKQCTLENNSLFFSRISIGRGDRMGSFGALVLRDFFKYFNLQLLVRGRSSMRRQPVFDVYENSSVDKSKRALRSAWLGT